LVFQTGIQVETCPFLCPIPAASETCAVHVAAPSGYTLNGCHVDGFDVVPLVKVVILDEAAGDYKVLYCPAGHPSRVLHLPKSVVCIKYPIVVSYSEDAGLISFQYRMTSLISTRAIGFEFKVDGHY
jgi:hypothetical protein